MSQLFDSLPKIPVPLDNWWFFAAVLAGLIILIGLVIRFVSSQTDDIDPVEIDRQMLSSVRELNRTGEISEDEYRSIKGRLVDRLKTEDEIPSTVSSPESQDSHEKLAGTEVQKPEDPSDSDDVPQEHATDNSTEDEHPRNP